MTTRIIAAAEEALAIARGQAQPASIAHFVRVEWHPIDTAPTDRLISLVVQSYDGSIQRVISPCGYRGDPMGDLDQSVDLSETEEVATHWGEAIPMPDVDAP